jgi:hypothetical protein
MRNIALALALVVGMWMMAAGLAAAHNVVLLDDCDPTDYN